MFALTTVPFSLRCSVCSHLLLEGSISIENGEEHEARNILISRVDIICPICGTALALAEDDLSRAMQKLNLEL